MDKYDDKFNKLKKELYNNLNFMLSYLENYCILNENLHNAIIPKYSCHINNDNSKRKEDILRKYELYLNNFYNFYNKIFEDYSFQLPKNEKIKIESDINNWKLNITTINIKKELDNAINVICKDKEPKNYYY